MGGDLMVYNMPILQKTLICAYFEHTQNWPRGGPRGWAHKKNCPTDTSRQKTVSESTIDILFRNKIKFHMYLMSWLACVATGP